MTTPPDIDTPIRSAADLTRRWVEMLGSAVFSARSLWLTWLDDDGRMLPLVVPVDDVPPVPDVHLVPGLLNLHGMVTAAHLHGEGHLAMALCRPGTPEITRDDGAWAPGLSDLGDRIDGTWSLHLAAGGRVRELVAPHGGWPRR